MNETDTSVLSPRREASQAAPNPESSAAAATRERTSDAALVVRASGVRSSAINGADIIVQTLLELGVDTVFGYPGGAVLPLYDALYWKPQLHHVLVRHEQAAVHAAQGYARTTGRVGVVFVTSGPGMSNTTTGLLDALCDSIPVLCISGPVATTSLGTAALQECDGLGISRPVTKWNAQVRDASELPALVRKAFAIAQGPRPGPGLIDFPKDLQLQPATLDAPPMPRPSPAPAVLPYEALAE